MMTSLLLSMIFTEAKAHYMPELGKNGVGANYSTNIT